MPSKLIFLFLAGMVFISGCGDSDGGDDRIWRAPQQISTVSITVDEPQVAVDSFGNVFVVWEQYNAIVSTRLEKLTRAWSAPENISPTSLAARSPVVDSDPIGNAIAAWSDSGLVFAANYDASQGRWSTPAEVSNSLALARSPELVSDPLGNTTLAWTQTYNTLSSISSSRYNSTLGSWEPVQVISEGTDLHSNVDLSADSYGNIFAVWEEAGNIYASRYLFSGGEWSPPLPLGVGRDPQVSAVPNGNAIVVWDSPALIHARLYLAGVGWMLVDEVGSGDLPKIAVDNVGNALALWQDGGVVYSSRYDHLTQSWGSIKYVDAGVSVQVVVDRYGRWTAAWNDSGNIRSAMYTSLEWGYPATLNLLPSLDAIPQLDVDLSGSVTVVWRGVDAIYSARYE